MGPSCVKLRNAGHESEAGRVKVDPDNKWFRPDDVRLASDRIVLDSATRGSCYPRELLNVVAVLEVFYFINSGPDEGQGTLDGPGTRGSGSGGSRGPGRTTKIKPTLILFH